MRRPNPYLTLQRQICDCGTPQARLLIGVAVVLPALFLGAGLLAGLHGAVIALLVLIPTPLLGVALGLRGRRRWPALDVMWWQNRQDAATWQLEVGGSPPRNAAGARSWLESHPEGSTPAWARGAVLLLAGRLYSARQTIAAMPVETPADRRRRLDLELVADAQEGLPIDTTAVDAAIREDPDQPPEEVAVHLAYHEALVEVDRGGDGLPPLLAARAGLGSMPSDLSRRLWLHRFRYAAGSFAVGAWLLAMVLVGLATSGGVVWF
ncbi:MAG: hypothetical protein ACXWNR_03970, partial [Candidatus Limnocylindrales bacterium]